MPRARSAALGGRRVMARARRAVQGSALAGVAAAAVLLPRGARAWDWGSPWGGWGEANATAPYESYESYEVRAGFLMGRGAGESLKWRREKGARETMACKAQQFFLHKLERVRNPHMPARAPHRSLEPASPPIACLYGSGVSSTAARGGARGAARGAAPRTEI